MDQYQEYSIYSGKSNNIFSVKLLEITFIFFIIFSVICKITNHEFIHYSGVISKIINFVVSKLSGEEKGLISYVDEMAIYGLRSNQINVVVSKDINNLPSNHISNISPTNNFPISTPNLKLDENGNIIPDDTFLKSNPFLIPTNSNKKTEVKENPNQYPTIIVTLPNEAILPYSPKIPMDIYYREGWVDYSNPNAEQTKNVYNPREIQKKKDYDFNYLAPLIPRNHFSLKLQQSFIMKNKDSNKNDASKQEPSSEASSEASISQDTINTTSSSSSIAAPSSSFTEAQLIGGYYVNDNVNEYAEEYELVNHAFWWQEDNIQQPIAV